MLFLHNCAVTLSMTALVFAVSLQSGPQDKYPMEPVFIEPGLKELASSRLSMVSSAHPFATKAGLAMLRSGGNAMDAAIAATMVTAIVDVGLTSFGGGGELTYYDAKTKKVATLEFYVNGVADDVMPFNGGKDGTTGRSIGIPGSIAGFYRAVQKYGALQWKQVMEPAIFYAEDGFSLYGTGYSIMQDRYSALTLRESGRRIFAPKDFLPHVGSIIKQPELAETLKKIADQGPDYFYKGRFAEQMVKAIREIGGQATLEDFSSYRVLESEPIRGKYKEYSIVGLQPPSMGSVAIIEGMNILENVDLKGMGHYSQSADSLQWAIETTRVIFNDSHKYSGIPELDLPLARTFMSKDYATAQYRLIRHKIEQMQRMAKEKPTQRAKAESFPFIREAEPHTNHVAVVDKDGNVCSITHTISGAVYSSHGLFVGGIVLNSARDHSGQPGGRMLNPLAPMIVFKGEKPYFATGSSGGLRNTFFTLLNVLAWDKNLKEAQEAPRFQTSVMTLRTGVEEDNEVAIEHRVEEKVADELKNRGYEIQWLAPYSEGGVRALGGVQMIGIDPNSGMRYGATDPRGVGLAAGQ